MVQTNDGRIHIADPAHVTASPAGQLTPDLATEWGEHCDFISANPSKFQGHLDLIQATGCQAGVYVKTNQDPSANLADDAYSMKIDAKTHALRRRWIERWKVYLMEPTSKTWINKHVADLKAIIAKYPSLDFFFHDSAGNYSFTADPGALRPGTKTLYTQAEWLQLLRLNLDNFASAVPRDFRVINGLQDVTVDLYTPCIGQIEAAFGSLDGVLPTQTEFNKLFDQVWYAQSKGWTPWLYVKMRAAFGTDTWDKFRSYCLPAAFLMDRGSLLYCQLAIEGGDPSWITGEYKHPWYKPDIGLPDPIGSDWRQSMLQPSGALVRLYERGAVLLNPTTAGVSVTMPDGTAIPVDAQSGKIMQENTVTTWVPVGG